jgi:inosine-uridine nucleoside N-ribohydrolase
VTVRLWVDTDIGDDPDDAVALTVATRHPDVELVGVSTVYGDVARRAGLARELFAALGLDVPVHAGPVPAEALRAADALLAIGPLTNVARLCEVDATAVPARFVAMGGALGDVRHRGAMYRVEHNFRCDPAAAAVVVERCPHLVLVPLDVTARLTMTPAATAALGDAAPVLRAPIEAFTRATGAPLCLHDPCALLVLLGDVGTTRSSVRIAVGADGRVTAEEAAGARTVVVDVDPPAVIDRVLRVTEGTRTPGLRDHNPTL